MPRGDGTGPEGKGPMTGRGAGPCGNNDIAGFAGAGHGRGRGRGRLVVTEPTPSGEHDLDRILNLTRHFDIPAAVCVNKWDVNPSMAERIERRAREQGAAVVGRVRYDIRVTAAQLQARAPVETPCDIADDIRKLWQDLGCIASAHGIRLAPTAESPTSSGAAQPIKGAV